MAEWKNEEWKRKLEIRMCPNGHATMGKPVGAPNY